MHNLLIIESWPPSCHAMGWVAPLGTCSRYITTDLTRSEVVQIQLYIYIWFQLRDGGTDFIFEREICKHYKLQNSRCYGIMDLARAEV